MNTKSTIPENYLQKYSLTIAPKLKEIDLYIKCQSPPLSIKKISELLSISEAEINQIIKNENIRFLDSKAFFKIMSRGTSELCRLFTRELKCGIPEKYAPQDISYIYNIDIDTVLSACSILGVTEFKSKDLELLFSKIYV